MLFWHSHPAETLLLERTLVVASGRSMTWVWSWTPVAQALVSARGRWKGRVVGDERRRWLTVCSESGHVHWFADGSREYFMVVFSGRMCFSVLTIHWVFFFSLFANYGAWHMNCVMQSASVNKPNYLPACPACCGCCKSPAGDVVHAHVTQGEIGLCITAAQWVG